MLQYTEPVLTVPLPQRMQNRHVNPAFQSPRCGNSLQNLKY